MRGKVAIVLVACAALLTVPAWAQQANPPYSGGNYGYGNQQGQVQQGQATQQGQMQGGQLQQGQLQQGQMMSNTDFLKGSKVIGLEVKDAHQNKIGKIDDLAVDANTGLVRYVIIDVKDVQNISGKLLPVPWNALQPSSQATVKDGTLSENFCILNVNKDDLQRAPVFASGQWPDFNNQRWTVAITEFFRPYIATQQRGALTR
jgi:hypothetical protein